MNDQRTTLIQVGRAAYHAGLFKKFKIKLGADIKKENEDLYYTLVGFLNHCLELKNHSKYYAIGKQIVERNRKNATKTEVKNTNLRSPKITQLDFFG